MRTLVLHDVPDDVVARLERLAQLSGTSITAVAVQELTAVSRRMNNSTLLSTLPDLGLEVDGVLDAGRAER